ncbi:MAG: YggS family pyridoxal phosphate-dependent enzyme [Chitinophagales bacterium]|nr:YggS family pyridoxal phosphate-dependent enzyme [Chitinophagaceae bacterium]MCB9064416.1 YggS family pyridoxal phosphate-dependent enzyme [Chitinophagales bacterium]
MVQTEVWKKLKEELNAKGVTLVAVSKKKPVSDIQEVYDLGQRDFGENYVQELVDKQPQLPTDIKWHYIGHLQTNKVKYVAPFVHLIHAVDSMKLLSEINKQAVKSHRVIDVLLQLHIADEETKFGLSKEELIELLEQYSAQKTELSNVRICGLMGMATFTDDLEQVRKEFGNMKNIFTFAKDSYFMTDATFDTCSMGMSGDYEMAVEEGSTLVRIGSMIFGERN